MIKITNRILAFILTLTIVIPAGSLTIADAAENISNWTVSYTNVDGEVTIDKTVFHSGNASMKIVNNTPKTSDKFIQIATAVPLVEGRKYYVGAWAKAADSTSLYFSVNWGARNYLTGFGQSFDWRNYEYIFTATETATRNFQFIVEGVTSGVWLDDIRFIDTVTGENLIKNSNFDTGGGAELSDSSLESIYDEISSGNSFSEEDMIKVRGGFKYMPVYSAENIEIDGSGADWENYPGLAMPTLSTQYQIYKDDGKDRDVKATSKFAYDDENFYLFVEVQDDNFVYITGNDGYWKGDSIQLAISGMEEPYGSEIGFAYNPETNKGEVYGTAFSKEDMKKISIAASNNGTKTIYEAAVPWNLKFDERPDAIYFNVLVNDNDGDGRRYCVELAPGISEGKTNKQFPLLEFLDSKKDWYAWVQSDRTGYIGEEHGFDCFLVNSGEDKNFTLKNLNDGTEEKIFVPAHSGIRHEIKSLYDEEGSFSQAVTFSVGEDSFTSSAGVEIIQKPATKEYTENVISAMKSQTEELKNLISKCEKAGIAVDYEKINYRVLELFTSFMQSDLKQNDLSRVNYTEKTTTELYNEAKNNMAAYLSGEKLPKLVPEYVTSDMSINGQTVSAETQLDGIKEERPVYFIGYGHFDRARNDMNIFNDLGANTIQGEVGPRHVMSSTGSTEFGKEYAFNPESDRVKTIIKMLEDGEKYNVAVSLLVSPHYFQTDLIEKYDIGTTEGGFLSYNVNAPIARAVIEEYLRNLIPLVKDYKSLNNICISNEPGFSVAACGNFYLDEWHEYLKERYGTIEALNKSYESSFGSFDEIDLKASSEQPAKFYDYKKFNDKKFSEWHMWMADIIHEIAPDIPLHTKIMGYTADRSVRYTYNGTGYEFYYDKLALNGCDYWNYCDDDRGPFVKEMWYDYMCSIKNAPVINSEDHIIPDRNQNFAEEIADYVGQDMYQGAIHGRGLSDIWVWEKTYDKSSDFYGSILERPDAVAEVGKASLDTNRLSYELSALANEPSDVGIIYSDMSILNDTSAMPAAYEAYASLILNGKRPKFIVETQLYKMHGCKLLIVPNTKFVTSETLNELKKYIDNGGRVVIMGENLMKKNERNLDNDIDLINYIYSNSRVIAYRGSAIAMKSTPSGEELAEIVREELKNAGAYYCSVVDAETGKPVYNVESNLGVYDGDVILNLLNFDEKNAEKKVKILLGGKTVERAFELINQEETGDVITLKRYKPQTLRIEWDNHFVDTFGHWAEEDIKYLNGRKIVSGMSESRYEPNSSLTRAQFLSLLSRASGLGEKNYNGNVPDVSADDWYAKNVAAALDAGIINAGTTFRPNDIITREEMCVLLVDFYEQRRGEIKVYEEAGFIDSDKIMNTEAVSKAVSKGFMYGRDDRSFAPLDGATRAEAAAVITRFIR